MIRELNRVIDYIEEHLTNDISLEAVADYAGVSDFHFRKVFFHLSGMTLSEYIKNRRLSEAGRDLLAGERVVDVAYKYGYESTDGFARAFKKWSGLLPSDIIKKKTSKIFPKFSFKIIVTGGISMEFRIENKPAFNFFGVSKRVPMQFEGVNNEVVKLAQSITEEQKKEMHALRDIAPFEILNISYDADAGFMKEEGGLIHMIGVMSTKKTSERLEKLSVEACLWAVFPNEGPFPETLQQTMARTYGEWLPSSDYELIDAPTFSFTKMDKQRKNYAYCEIWIPVREK
ncbi:AraC family transcriptional regulator [Dysgonomonas sp. Marseille-P4677]|uniref:AraC family transcriptional regulator n=1 Tax=Dysgonomonas sp. Marseille-P4677 TaxID=2364790 RepID=UPI0019140096|nr:AraC family transcriptional regulator [Dysgonomonas sp. Marseille-P4677]MBK5721805.1 AraC family transcriptional regulator [Dysgonomonas sp. Marseille-P4677]